MTQAGSKTLTRDDIKDAVHAKLGLSKAESGQLVEWVFSEISNTLIAGEEVKISRFGTFSVHEKKERKGRNPKTGEEVPIAARRVVTFRASPNLKKEVERGGRG
ncbi:MAG: integration host factor subunit alpha [Alphaproteobacteria bacterium]|nr:MAG: integration host factor subunit alpha [Alphaproteobacteria bacterium]